jgi:hypothetical protein
LMGVWDTCAYGTIRCRSSRPRRGRRPGTRITRTGRSSARRPGFRVGRARRRHTRKRLHAHGAAQPQMGTYKGDGTVGSDETTWGPARMTRPGARRRNGRVVPVPVKAGSVVFHHCLTWHGAPPNPTDQPRPAIAVHYMPGYTRYERPKRPSRRASHHRQARRTAYRRPFPDRARPRPAWFRFDETRTHGAAALLAAALFTVTGTFARTSRRAKSQHKRRSGGYTPQPGTRERKAILDALRKPVQKRVGRPVIFPVDSSHRLSSKCPGRWPRATPQEPDAHRDLRDECSVGMNTPPTAERTTDVKRVCAFVADVDVATRTQRTRNARLAVTP